MSAERHWDSALARLAARWGQAAGLITASNIGSQVLGVATAIILTYFVAIGAYGRYAIAVFYASMLTIFLNAGSLQGAAMTVFGAADEDDGGDDTDDLLDSSDQFDRRRFLTSVLVATFLLGCLAVALTVVFAAPLSALLYRRRGGGDLLVLAAVSGAIGATWRYAVNILRVERRIHAYCVQRMLRPIFTLLAIAVLVANGAGIRGALVGLAIGSALGLVPTLITSRRTYRFAVHPADFRRAMRNGLPYIPIAIFSGFVHGAGVFLLGGYRTSAGVGEFSVASSMSAVNAHFVSGFLSSFSPIRRTSLFAAAQRDAARLRRAVVHAFVATGLLLFVSVALLAPELVLILPTAYRGAAAIVPYALIGWTGYGFYMVIYRMAEFPHKRLLYVGVSILSAGLYWGFSAVLDPRFGGAGQGVAMGLTYTVTWAIIFTVSQHSEEPLPLDMRRITIVSLVAGISVFGFQTLADALPSYRLVLELAGIAVFAVALLCSGLVPRALILAIWRSIRGLVPDRSTAPSTRAEIAQLDPSEARILTSLGAAQDPGRLAAQLGLTERELELRTVAALRSLAGLGGPRACDMRIGAYLLSPKAMAERDVLVRRLREEVDPDEIDRLETTMRLVQQAARGDRRARRERRATDRGSPISLPQPELADEGASRVTVP